MAGDDKIEGKKAYEEGRFQDAVGKYTDAIKLDPSDHELYSNRSAAYAQLKQYENSLKDAEETIILQPDWFKGYFRKGTALEFLGRFEEALKSYKEAQTKEPNNENVKKAIESCEEKCRTFYFRV